jgi:hypothetical protein
VKLRIKVITIGISGLERSPYFYCDELSQKLFVLIDAVGTAVA